MQERGRMAREFEAHREHLRAVAYRMLGSPSDADDALQEAWIRVDRATTNGVENPGGWLTTVVARVCLDMLRARRSRREQPYEPYIPEPVVEADEGGDPEREAVLADSVGLALLVVMETLSPAERLAFVLHDMFGVGFAEIAEILDRSPDAARQLASRARRRVRGSAPPPDVDVSAQREVVDAFLAAAREGDFDALVALLDPDVVVRVDRGRPGVSRELRGAEAVASQALRGGGKLAPFVRPAMVNGAPGMVLRHPTAGTLVVAGFTVANGKVVEIDVIADRQRLQELGI